MEFKETKFCENRYNHDGDSVKKAKLCGKSLQSVYMTWIMQSSVIMPDASKNKQHCVLKHLFGSG